MKYFQKEIALLKQYQQKEGQVGLQIINEFAEAKNIDLNIEEEFSVSEVIVPGLIKEFTQYIS